MKILLSYFFCLFSFKEKQNKKISILDDFFGFCTLYCRITDRQSIPETLIMFWDTSSEKKTQIFDYGWRIKASLIRKLTSLYFDKISSGFEVPPRWKIIWDVVLKGSSWTRVCQTIILQNFYKIFRFLYNTLFAKVVYEKLYSAKWVKVINSETFLAVVFLPLLID